jgi:hypothetical protein
MPPRRKRIQKGVKEIEQEVPESEVAEPTVKPKRVRSTRRTPAINEQSSPEPTKEEVNGQDQTVNTFDCGTTSEDITPKEVSVASEFAKENDPPREPPGGVSGNSRKRPWHLLASAKDSPAPKAKKPNIEAFSLTTIPDLSKNTSNTRGISSEPSVLVPKRDTNTSSKTIKRFSSQQSSSDNEEIVNRYQKLRELRETRAEELLREYRTKAEVRFKAADELFRELTNQKQNTDLEELDQLEELKQKVDTVEALLENANEEIQVLNAKLQANNNNTKNANKLSLGLISDMSGLVVTNVTHDDTQTTYNCLHSGRNGNFQYLLGVAGDDITFTPQLDPIKDEYLISVLPEYFTEPLSFTRDAVRSTYNILTWFYTNKDDPVQLENL